jgi:hypothetical protein
VNGGKVLGLGTHDLVVLGVALLAWALLFFYLLRIERRIRDLEKR